MLFVLPPSALGVSLPLEGESQQVASTPSPRCSPHSWWGVEFTSGSNSGLFLSPQEVAWPHTHSKWIGKSSIWLTGTGAIGVPDNISAPTALSVVDHRGVMGECSNAVISQIGHYPGFPAVVTRMALSAPRKTHKVVHTTGQTRHGPVLGM